MNKSFEEGFEKTAFIGGLAKTFATRLGKSAGNFVTKRAKNVGTKIKADFVKNPLSATGGLAMKGLTAGFIGMEALNAIDKTKADIARPKGVNMTSDSFYQLKR